MGEPKLKTPFTNAQLELLKAFSLNLNLNLNELKRLKKTFTDILSDRLISEANRVWDEEGWDDAYVEKLLDTKLRLSKV